MYNNWGGVGNRVPRVLDVLSYRLDVSNILMKDSDPVTAFRLQLYQDQHLDLLDELLELVRLEGMDALRDKGRMIGIGGLVHAFAPSMERVPCCYRLPDMVSFIRVCNLKYHIIPEDATIIGAVCHVLAKAVNHNCLPRNASEIYTSYSCPFPIMDAWIREMIQVSLLGNYPWATMRPEIGTRLMIRRAFRRRVCPKQIQSWMQRHEKIVRYCTREYHAYLIGFLPLVEDELMSLWCPWKESKDAIRFAMDEVRALISIDDINPVQLGTDVWMGRLKIDKPSRRFALATEQMEVLHDSTLRSNHKLFKGHWCTVFLTHMMDDGKTYLLKWEGVETSPINYHRWARELSRLSGRSFEQVDKILQAASEAERYFCRERNFRITELWLKYMGMSSSAVSKLHKFHDDYMNNSISDNSLASHLWPCVANNMRDRVVLLGFLFKVHADIRNATFRLPEEVAEAQRAALRRRAKLAPYDEDPEWLGEVLYCEKCEEWRTPVVAYEKKSGKKGTWNDLVKPLYSNGIAKVMYDMETNSLRCKKKRMSRSSKRRKKKQQFLKLGQVISDKEADMLLNTEEMWEDKGGENRAWQTCCCHPITTINMIGKIKKLRKGIYCLCAYCGSLANYNAKTLDRRVLPNCGMHLHGPLKNDDSNNKDASLAKKCFYCSCNIWKDALSVCIINDEAKEGESMIFYAYLCAKDARQSYAYRKNQKESGDILLKSVLFRTIHEFRVKNPIRRTRTKLLA